jgi:hypothetical protein
MHGYELFFRNVFPDNLMEAFFRSVRYYATLSLFRTPGEFTRAKRKQKYNNAIG